MAKKAKSRTSQSKLKDLAPKSRTAGAVKGGRITNVRANASGISGGSAGGGTILAAIPPK
jgi:hypothetical protein